MVSSIFIGKINWTVPVVPDKLDSAPYQRLHSVAHRRVTVGCAEVPRYHGIAGPISRPVAGIGRPAHKMLAA